MDGEAIKLGFFCVAGLSLGLWLFFSAFSRLRLRRAVEAMPTSKARSAAMGKCELKGLARESELPILGPFTGKPCVWYRCQVEEERRDSKGRSSWHTVEDRHSVEPFYIEDPTGRIKVDPQGAEVEAPRTLNYSSGILSFGKVPQGPQAAAWLRGGFFSGRRRLSEWRIDQARPIYALGVLRQGSPEPLFAQGRSGEPFFISTSSEEEILSGLLWGSWGRALVGALLAALGAGMLLKLVFGL